MYTKSRPTHEKHHSTTKIDEGSKENYQSRANNPESKYNFFLDISTNIWFRVRTGEKMATAIFQRKFLRKPSPSHLVNSKNQVFIKKTSSSNQLK